MPLRATENEDIRLFKELCGADRIEEMTCRPVGNATRTDAGARSENWTYVMDGGASPAGWVRLFDFNPRNRSAEFGYGVIPALRGQGVATGMLAAAFDRAFSSLDLNKLHCQTASFNTASVRLLERLGLTRDGVLRAHHELDGELHDDHIYSLLKDEWLDAGRKP